MTNQDKIDYMRQKVKQSKRGKRLSEQEARLIGSYSYGVLQEVDEDSQEALDVLRLLVAL